MTILFLRGYLPIIIKNRKVFYGKRTCVYTIKYCNAYHIIITFYYHENKKSHKNRDPKIEKNQKKYVFPCKKQKTIKIYKKTIMIKHLFFLLKKCSMGCMVIKSEKT